MGRAWGNVRVCATCRRAPGWVAGVRRVRLWMSMAEDAWSSPSGGMPRRVCRETGKQERESVRLRAVGSETTLVDRWDFRYLGVFRRELLRTMY